MTITLLDKNDSPPTFTLTSYDLEVPEDVTPGHVIASLVAEDPDQGSTVLYSIEGGADGKFSIDPVKGRLDF